MKRLFTLVICLSLIQIAKAANLPGHPLPPLPVLQGNQSLADTALVPVVGPAKVNSNENATFKQQLDAIKKDVPLDYNEYVQSYIDLYVTPSRRDEMGHILGLSKYYFPIYEKAFRDAGIPEEIKYLSIVESQLNPYAVSRVGATGPWQFMFTTAKIYGLNIDNYVDERMDPIQSSYAAAAYLKDAYQEFGDWLLAIASYNCGKSNVINAIGKAGANDYWSIRPFLPVETRGYVPAYIAITYVMNYNSRYKITAQACNFSTKTDTIMVTKLVSLASVAQAMGIGLYQLTILNPAYKLLVINGASGLPKRLVIPKAEKEKYAALYDLLTGDAALPVKTKAGIYAHGESTRFAEQAALPKSRHGSNKKTVKEYVTYKVRSGDTLTTIANKFAGITVEQIKQANGLKKSRLQPGTLLKISKS